MVKKNKGHIVEIASMSSFLGVGVFSDYSAGKTALVSFTESESLTGLPNLAFADVAGRN
jgi:short-subunit dehydrogenase